MKEAYAEKIYILILKKIVYPLLGNTTTYLGDLDKICKTLLGKKFYGVYPSDQIPVLTEEAPYAILNLDNSTEPGSHWIAIAKKGNDTLTYDSFGRSNTEIIPDLKHSGNGSIIDTDNDTEQKITQLDCGSRCVSWLLLFDNWGADVAQLI